MYGLYEAHNPVNIEHMKSSLGYNIKVTGAQNTYKSSTHNIHRVCTARFCLRNVRSLNVGQVVLN